MSARSASSSVNWRHLVKQGAAGLLYATRHGWSAQGGARILYYHRVADSDLSATVRSDITVTVESFSRQLECLLRHFDIVPLEELIDDVEAGRDSRRRLAISFDDGYIDNYALAYPILRRHSVPATIFVATGFVGSRQRFWWDALALAVERLRHQRHDRTVLDRAGVPPPLQELMLGVAAGRLRLTELTNALKRTHLAFAHELVRALEEQLQFNCRQADERLFLTWDEMSEMSRNGITFGAHSQSHAILPDLDDDRLTQEVEQPRALIRQHLGSDPAGFSYPDGCYDERVRRAVIRAGYRYAVQTSRGQNHGNDDFYALPRRMVKQSHSTGIFGEFASRTFVCEVTGIFDRIALRAQRRVNPYANRMSNSPVALSTGNLEGAR
jgi:peptidoglycan/xylan/chitin deacetylase (PgdA/CDA1 family)